MITPKSIRDFILCMGRLNSCPWGMVFAVGMLVVSPRSIDGAGPPDPRCGAHCLYVCLRSLEFPVASVEEVEKKLGSVSNAGYSLAQLLDAAKSLGAHAVAVETTLDDLARRKGRFACIVRLVSTESAHYVIVADVDAGFVTMVDVPHKPVKVPRTTFDKQWDRSALLISTVPIEAVPPAGIGESLFGRGPLATILAAAAVIALIAGVYWARRRFTALKAILGAALLSLAGCESNVPQAISIAEAIVAPRSINLGRIPIDSADGYRTAILLRNVGNRTIRVAAVRTSCGCTVAHVANPSISPQSSTTIEVRIEASRPGDGRATVSLECDNGQTVVSELVWTCVPAIEWRPTIVELGNVRTHAQLAGALHLRSGLNRRLRIAGARSTDPELRIAMGWDDDQHVITPEQWHRIPLAVESVESGSSPGSKMANIVVEAIDGSQRHSVNIPVQWKVSPVVRAIPERVFLRSDLSSDQCTFNDLLLRAEGGEALETAAGILVDEQKNEWVQCERVDRAAFRVHICLARIEKGVGRRLLKLHALVRAPDTERAAAQSIQLEVPIYVAAAK